MADQKFFATEHQLRAFVSPVRADIFQNVAALGPRTAAQIAKGLSLPATSLYHHLDQLVAAGVLQRSKLKAKLPGRPAVFYTAVRRSLYLAEEPSRPDRKLIAKIVRASALRAARDFKTALSDPKSILDGRKQNLVHIRSSFVVSEADLARLNSLLDELRTIVMSSKKASGQLLTINLFVSPAQRKKKERTKRGAVAMKAAT